MKYSKLPHVFAVGILSLVLSACGDSSDSEESTTPAPVQAAPTTVETTEEATEEATEEMTEPAQTTETTEEVTSEDATDSSEDPSSDPTDSVSFGGEWSVTVDGAPIEFPNPIVGCTNTAETQAIVVVSSDTSTLEGVSIYLSQDDQPTVQAVSLVQADGTALAYAEDQPFGSATVTKDGNTYTVTGEALLVDASNMNSLDTKPFEVVVTCD